MSEYDNYLKKYGSDRKAAKALGISRTQFNNKYRKLAGLCVVVGCKSPPKTDCTRCEVHLQKAKSKKSKEEISEKNYLYRLSHTEKLAIYNKTYQAKNLKKFRVSRKKYDQTPSGKLSSLERRARRRKKEDFTMSTFELDFLKAKTPHCIICGPGKKISLDHFVPLSKGGKLILSNTVVLCTECNSRKRGEDPEKFFSSDKLQEIRQLFESHEEFKSVKSPKEYEIKKESNHAKCRNFIRKYHYSGSSPGITHAFTLSFKGRVLGVCLFSKPSRQNIKVPGTDNILELSRLFVVDDTPKNTESRFIGKCLQWLKRHTKLEAIVSFSDPTEGHEGTIYKASNFKFLGHSLPNYHYVTTDGERIHKRQVWDRSVKNNIKESEQAKIENLQKIEELPKNKFVFYLKKI